MVKVKYECRTSSQSQNYLIRIYRKVITVSMFFIIKISYKTFKNMSYKKLKSHFKSLERAYKIKSPFNVS